MAGDGPVNHWQEVLYELCLGSHSMVEPKRIAHGLHRAHNFISDICRRERVDPLAVFNEILRQAEHRPFDQRVAIAGQVYPLLFCGTGWQLVYVQLPPGSAQVDRLYEHTGILLKDLGGALEALAHIERDGRYDEADDPQIEEFLTKSVQLVNRVQLISAELRRRREVGAPA